MIRRLLALLLFSATVQAQFVTDRGDSGWQEIGGLTALGGQTFIRDSAIDPNGRIFVAFDVQLGPSLTHSRIAVHDPATSAWEILPSPIESARFGIRSIAYHPVDGLYVVGRILSAVGPTGLQPLAGIARWDEASQTWDDLGGGVRVFSLSGSVSELAIGASGKVCVVGNFDNALNRDGSTTSGMGGVGCWDGASWESLGGGIVSITGGEGVYLTVRQNDNVVLAGELTGTFQSAGVAATPRSHIAEWDGAQWQSVGLGLTAASVSGVVEHFGELVLTGYTLGALNPPADTIRTAIPKWDGTAWSDFSTGMAVGRFQTPTSLSRSGNGTLYTVFLGEIYSRAAGAPAWQSFSQVDNGAFQHSLATLAAHPGADEVYTGGQFSEVIDMGGTRVSAANHARFDANAWNDLGEIDFGQADGIRVIEQFATTAGNRLLVAGTFDAIGFSRVRKIGLYDGGSVIPLGGGVSSPTDATVNCVAFFQSQTEDLIYVGGRFDEVTNTDGTTVAASNIAVFDVRNDEWRPVGGGVNGEVHDLELSIQIPFIGPTLFVGGAFTEVVDTGGTRTNRTGIAWYGISDDAWKGPDGVSGGASTVYSLDVELAFGSLPRGNVIDGLFDLFIGGEFETTLNGGAQVPGTNNVARYSGISGMWHPLEAGGPDGPVYDILYRRSFNNNVAHGVPEVIDGILYVGGSFASVQGRSGPIAAANLVRWDFETDAWVPFGSAGPNGANGAVRTIEHFRKWGRTSPSQHVELLVGGDFTVLQTVDGPVPANRFVSFVDFLPSQDTRQMVTTYGSAMDGPVAAVERYQCVYYHLTVYAGGSFTTAGPKQSPGFAKWNLDRSKAAMYGTIRTSAGACTGSCKSRIGIRRLPTSPLCPASLGKSDANVTLLSDAAFGDTLQFALDAEFVDQELVVTYLDESRVLPRTDTLAFSGSVPTFGVLAGVPDPSDYVPNPQGIPTDLTLRIASLPDIPDAATTTESRILFFNAVTDAAAIRIVDSNAGVLFEAVPYAEFGRPVVLPTGPREITVEDTQTGETLGTYSILLNGGFEALVLEGFKDPSANQNGPPMNLVVTPIETRSLLTTDVESRGRRDPFRVYASYPNPVQNMATIEFDLSEAGSVRMEVFDVLGREVSRLDRGRHAAGRHSYKLDTSGFASGVYFYRLVSGDHAVTRQLVVAR